MNNSEVTPSKYWNKDPELKHIMEAWDAEDVLVCPTENYNTTNTEQILKEILN